ncbi:MAG: Extracellular solute-binding protein family 1 [Parcubacteria group bacterium GW2011_GWA2_47_26]|nr:MAG: Extracellular solute-binding protein family 1 [Parcubacteria group bacterium GW2011_GWA2_47_26]
MQKKITTKIALLISIVLMLSLTGIQCTRGISREVAEATRPVTLNWWRTFDDEEAVRPIMEAYRILHPNVNIVYRKLRFEDYERELLNALAEDRGPDIFSIHNTWMREWQPKLAHLPPILAIPFQEVKGGLRKEVVATLRRNPTLTLRQLQTNFTDVVASDVVIAERDPQTGQPVDKIYGLPLALDTLALYYNRDLTNLSGIPEPPENWGELQNAVKRITKIDQEGKIILSGAALGASHNVERAADILALLMMQNGADMIDLAGNVAFDRIPQALRDRPIPPGEDALVFYTDFANPLKEVYTWNETMPQSLEAFTQGKTAFMLGYSYHLPQIRARSPRLNLGIAPAPQIEGNPEVNFANYWVEAVSKKSSNQHWAWDFIQFATKADQVTKYLNAAKKPTALRALVTSQLEDLDIGTFASQVLTAKSWYKGKDSVAAEAAFREMIEAVLTQAVEEPREALTLTAQKVNQTLR